MLESSRLRLARVWKLIDPVFRPCGLAVSREITKRKRADVWIETPKGTIWRKDENAVGSARYSSSRTSWRRRTRCNCGYIVVRRARGKWGRVPHVHALAARSDAPRLSRDQFNLWCRPRGAIRLVRNLVSRSWAVGPVLLSIQTRLVDACIMFNAFD